MIVGSPLQRGEREWIMSYRLLRAFLILLLCFGIFLSTRVTALAASADIQLSSSVGAPTSSIVVTGSNFQQGEKVIISFDALKAGSTTTDSTGAFKKDITVPANALPGNHSVDATGQTSGLSASATFLVRTNWPMSGYNQARTRYNHLENVIN